MTSTSLPEGAADNPREASVETDIRCKICGHMDAGETPGAFGAVRGNTARFANRTFQLWKCPDCGSIHSVEPVDFRDIYSDYPLNKRRLDVFARGTLRNLLRRLTRSGLKKTDAIIDYGCGNGIFVQFLKEQGYLNVVGYDPFVREFASLASDARFDCVVANDVIEHVADPRAMVRACADLTRRGGLLYIGTADSEPVHMVDLEPHVMRLHQPFHRIILTQAGLLELALETGFGLVKSWRRSYMDTWMPFSNYRFLDEFNRALGHNMDLAFDPGAGKVVARKPALLWYAFFGYLVPSAYEPAVILRRPGR